MLLQEEYVPRLLPRRRPVTRLDAVTAEAEQSEAEDALGERAAAASWTRRAAMAGSGSPLAVASAHRAS